MGSDRKRVQYFDPTNNIKGKKEGTYSDSITFPYEDYCIAVDLSIKIHDRYSCGWGSESGEYKEYNYSSDNGSIYFKNNGSEVSVLSGSKSKKSPDSFLTVNYTDISLTAPDANTSECLGIESISITYNSWMYPQVVIKFVDVRGATVFSPSEKAYFNPKSVDNKPSASSAIYRSLFSFPYPIFTLKVKGFYGKGATYKLAVEKTEMEFDASTGNFNIIVNFIGYMFGIYADLPMSYVTIAPYIPLGKDYWLTKIEDGTFVFRDENGREQAPMVTFPELRLKLQQVATNQEITEANTKMEQSIGESDERRYKINDLKATYPHDAFDYYFVYDTVNDQIITKNVARGSYTRETLFEGPATIYFFCYKSEQDLLMSFEKLAHWYIQLCEYEATYDVTIIQNKDSFIFSLVNYLSLNKRDNLAQALFDSYRKSVLIDKSEYTDTNFKNDKNRFQDVAKYVIKFCSVVNVEEGNYLEVNDEFLKTYDLIFSSYIPKTKEDLKKVQSYMKKGKDDGSGDDEKTNKSIAFENFDDIVSGKKWSEPAIFIQDEKGCEIYSRAEIYEMFQGELDKINSEKLKNIEKYKSTEASLIEKALGFRPSIKNIYNLLFAHMETFMHCFYSHTKIIKNQITEGVSGVRAKSRYGVGNGGSDTEDTLDNSNDYSKILPPYTAFYKTDTSNGETRQVTRWPEEVINGHTLEEVAFVKELLRATELYYDDSAAVNDIISSSSGASGSNLSTLSSVHNFIPLTPFDYAYLNKVKNPYDSVVEKLKNNDSNYLSEMMGILAFRLFYYAAVNGDIPESMTKIGKLEAVNLFKALKDNFTPSFLNLIKQYNDSSGIFKGAVSLELFIKTDQHEFNKAWRGIHTNLEYRPFADGTVTTYKTTTVYNTYPTSMGACYYVPYETVKEEKHTTTEYVFHKGFKFTSDEISNEEDTKGYVKSSLKDGKIVDGSFKATPDYTYQMFPMYFKDSASLYKKYTDDKSLLNDSMFLVLPKNDMTNSIDTKSQFIIIEEPDYQNDIYKSIINEVSRAKLAESVPYGNRKANQYGGIDGVTSDELGCLKNNFESVYDYEDKIHYQTGTIVDATGTWLYEHFNDRNDNEVLKSSYQEKKANYCIALPSMATQQLVSIDGDGSDFSLRISLSTIFDTNLYKQQTSIIVKAYLFLMSVPFRSSMYASFINHDYQRRTGKSGTDTKIRLLADGAYFWHMDNTDKVILKGNEVRAKGDETYRKNDFNMLPIKTHEKDVAYSKWNIEKNYSAAKKRVLTERFIKWATDEQNGFAAFEPSLKNNYFYTVVRDTTIDGDKVVRLHKCLNVGRFMLQNDEEGKEFKKLQDFLVDLFLNTVSFIDFTWTENVNTFGTKRFFAEKANLSCGFAGFWQQLKYMYGTAVKDYFDNTEVYNANVFSSKANDPFNNDDVRLSTYLTLKSLYDKWLCSPHLGPEKTWKLTADGTSNSDFDSFIYIDSHYHDIGYRLNVNATKVAAWIGNCLPTSTNTDAEGIVENNRKTVFQFITEVAQDSGGMLLALPQKFGMATAKDMYEMFTPQSIYSDWADDSSTFIFMYTYKPSEHLGSTDAPDADMNGWSSTGDGLDLTDEELIGSTLSDDGYSIPAFAVTYAKQNQSFFTNIKLSSQTNGVTEAGIAATMNIASKSGEGPRETTLYGQDLYRLFSQYAYKCSAEMMGNIQIMPLMYFQLNNVPLWKGAYTILKVNHNISAGKMTTAFEGIRINRYTIPLSQSTTIVYKNEKIDDELKEKIKTESVETTSTNVVDTTPTTSARETFDNPGGGDYNSILGEITHKPENITERKPLICLTPAHGPKTSKKIEWEWSTRVVNGVSETLKEYKFYDGTSYSDNIQICNVDGKNTGKFYSLSQVYSLIGKYGSKKVISVVPHWNECGGSYFITLAMNDKVRQETGRVDREDSLALSKCFIEEFQKIKDNRESFKTLPKGMINGHLTPHTQLRPEGNEPGLYPNCACATLECWFTDYGKESGSKWKQEGWDKKDTNGRHITGRGWLENEGFSPIVKAIADGIKRYIDSL